MGGSLTNRNELVIVSVMADDLDVLAIRTELGVSQYKLADLLGVDQSTISYWETGKMKPGGPARLLMQRLVEEHRERTAA